MSRVLQTFPMPDPVVEKLQDQHEVIQVLFAEGRALIEAASGVRGVVAGTESWSREIIEAVGPELEVISRVGTGVDSVDLKAATDHGIAVLNAPGENAQTIAELSVGLMWGLSRRIVEADRAVRTTGFLMRTEMDGLELWGKTVGIVGFGEIGRRVAAMCQHGFGMSVLVTTAHPDPERLESAGVDALFVELDALLDRADFVALHAAVNPQTERMIGEIELKAMKPSAYLINTSRGQLVDENALVAALSDGDIAGYGADVFDVEPPPADHPFFSLSNTILTPHYGSGTYEAMTRMSDRAVTNLIECLAGERPYRTVNPEVYERH